MKAHWLIYVGLIVCGVAIWLVPVPVNHPDSDRKADYESLTAHIDRFPETDTMEMDARPIFMATRRPLPVVLPTRARPRMAAAIEPSTDGIVLLGTILAGGQRIALLRSSAMSSTSLIQTGQTIGSWKVTEIYDDHVCLQAGARTFNLRFSLASNGKSTQLASSRAPVWLPRNAADFRK